MHHTRNLKNFFSFFFDLKSLSGERIQNMPSPNTPLHTLQHIDYFEQKVLEKQQMPEGLSDLPST